MNGSGTFRIHLAKHNTLSGYVKIWLIAGLVMIFLQVVIGGITRLTGSGLSITKWEIVTGILPPLNAEQWQTEFDLYKDTPQYEKINRGMSLGQFKFIYFWEFMHRLWARTLGFVFFIPFLYFLFNGMFSRRLLYQLAIVFLLAVLVASLGWIMVASGLIDRPWVNAYKLTFHLSLAFILYGFLLWTTFGTLFPGEKVIHNNMLKTTGIIVSCLLALQIFIGGIMSGMKAGLFFPTFPDMNGELLPFILLDSLQWNVDNFVNYDKNAFMPALIQVLHRSIAYILIISVLCYTYAILKLSKSSKIRTGAFMLITMLVIQFLLGVFTLIHCKGSIPVGLGVLHQAGALLLLSCALYLNYGLKYFHN